MQRSQTGGHSSARDADADAGSEQARIREQVSTRASDDEDYQGDNSDNNTDGTNSSNDDDDMWNRVVTFAEAPASRSSIHTQPGDGSASPLTGVAAQARRMGHRYPRAVHRMTPRRRHPGAIGSERSSPDVRQRLHESPGLSVATGNRPAVAKSHTDLERLRQDLQNTLFADHRTPSNTPGVDASAHDQLNTAPLVAYALDSPEPSPRHRAAGSRLSTPGHSNSKQESHAFPVLSSSRGAQAVHPHRAPQRLQRRHTLHYQAPPASSSRKNNTTATTTTAATTATTSSSVGSSSDEQTTPPSRKDSTNSSGIEKLWFRRAHTFSVGEQANAGVGMHRVNTAKSQDTIQALPRIMTVT
ncbi:hypothetical protein EV175_000460, partial [Coemansia sp. RSA 1933]